MIVHRARFFALLVPATIGGALALFAACNHGGNDVGSVPPLTEACPATLPTPGPSRDGTCTSVHVCVYDVSDAGTLAPSGSGAITPTSKVAYCEKRSVDGSDTPFEWWIAEADGGFPDAPADTATDAPEVNDAADAGGEADVGDATTTESTTETSDDAAPDTTPDVAEVADASEAAIDAATLDAAPDTTLDSTEAGDAIPTIDTGLDAAVGDVLGDALHVDAIDDVPAG